MRLSHVDILRSYPAWLSYVAVGRSQAPRFHTKQATRHMHRSSRAPMNTPECTPCCAAAPILTSRARCSGRLCSRSQKLRNLELLHPRAVVKSVAAYQFPLWAPAIWLCISADNKRVQGAAHHSQCTQNPLTPSLSVPLTLTPSNQTLASCPLPTRFPRTGSRSHCHTQHHSHSPPATTPLSFA